MKNTPQELKELFGENTNAIERMLLVTMLREAIQSGFVVRAKVMEEIQLASIDVDQMSTRYGGSEWTVAHLKEVLADTTTKYVEAKNALADAETNVSHLQNTIKDIGETTSVKGWRVPRRGGRLRLVKPVGKLIYGQDWISVGDIVTCEAIGSCIDPSIAISADAKNSWLIQTLPGVQILKPGDDTQVACLPLDCFEPVT